MLISGVLNVDERTENIETPLAQMVAEISRSAGSRIDSIAPQQGRGPDASTITALQHKRNQAALKIKELSTASDDERENSMNGSEQVMEVVMTLVPDSITKWILKGKPTVAGAFAAEGAYENENPAKQDA